MSFLICFWCFPQKLHLRRSRELSFGIASPCQAILTSKPNLTGGVKLRSCPLDVIEALKRALDRGTPAALVTVVQVEGEAPSRSGMQLAVEAEGAIFGTLGCDGFDSAGVAD